MPPASLRLRNELVGERSPRRVVDGDVDGKGPRENDGKGSLRRREDGDVEGERPLDGAASLQRPDDGEGGGERSPRRRGSGDVDGEGSFEREASSRRRREGDVDGERCDGWLSRGLPDAIEDRHRSESGLTVQRYEPSLLAEQEPRWLSCESNALSRPWRGAVFRCASTTSSMNPGPVAFEPERMVIVYWGRSSSAVVCKPDRAPSAASSRALCFLRSAAAPDS